MCAGFWAMELMCACQAVDLLGGQERLGKGTAPAYRTIRAVCATLEDDQPPVRGHQPLRGGASGRQPGPRCGEGRRGN